MYLWQVVQAQRIAEEPSHLRMRGQGPIIRLQAMLICRKAQTPFTVSL